MINIKKNAESGFDAIFQKLMNKKRVFSGVFHVENGGGDFSKTFAFGEMEESSPYFIASTTKLYITAVILNLEEKGKLSLEDGIKQHLPKSLVDGIHVLDGKEYTDNITIRHLISNTSGIPDYFFSKHSGASRLLEGEDESWPLEKTIAVVKKLKPDFPPGKRNKVKYSDTNYQLLGRIIENITDMPLDKALDALLFNPLGLKHTYAYKNTEDSSPVPFYYKNKKLWLPKYMVSITPEGGVVSTAKEAMHFLKAFFDGRFFQSEKLSSLKEWNLILPPPSLFFYGIGIEKLWLPRIIAPINPIGEIIGFWGQTGAFAWYNPKHNLYFTGTTNQIDGSGHAGAMKAIISTIKRYRALKR